MVKNQKKIQKMKYTKQFIKGVDGIFLYQQRFKAKTEYCKIKNK